MATRTGDPRSLSKALIARHGSLWDISQRDERREVLRTLGEVAPMSMDREIELMHKLLRITTELERGNINSVSDDMIVFSQIATELRRPALMWYSQMFTSMKALLEGHFDEVDDLAKQFLETGMKAVDQNSIHAHAAQIAIKNYELGRGKDIIPIIRSLVDRFPSVTSWRCTLAFLLSETGQIEEAQTEFHRLATFAFEDFSFRETDSIAINLLAATSARLRDTDRAKILYERLLPIQETHTVIAYAVAYFGPVTDRLAQLATVLGDWEAAFEHFEFATASCERIGSPPWLAHVLCHHAESRYLRGDPSDMDIAKQLLGRSSRLANRHGMIHLLQRIDTIQ